MALESKMKRRRTTRKTTASNSLKTSNTTESISPNVAEEVGRSATPAKTTPSSEGIAPDVGKTGEIQTQAESDTHNGDVNTPDPIDSGPNSSNVDNIETTQNESIEAQVELDVEDSEVWTPEKEDKLIDLFRSCVFLYDKTAPGFLQRHKKEMAMAKFAGILGVTGMYAKCGTFIYSLPLKMNQYNQSEEYASSK